MLSMFTLFLALATFAMVGVIIWSAVQNRRQPIRRARAIVLRRRTREDSLSLPSNPLPLILSWLGRGPGRPRISNDHLSRLSGETTIGECVNYFITFGVEGSEVELLVPEGMFMSLQDGETGTLVYQGELFKHFMRDSTAEPGYRPR